MRITIPLHISPNDHSRKAREARAELSYDLSQINPSGFRRPGKRSGTSLVERRAVQAGMMDMPIFPYRSERGDKKRERRRLHIAAVLAERGRSA